MATLDVLEHASGSYAPRTWSNAVEGDVTAAFAVDFTTAGEKLTHKAAGEKYVGIEVSRDCLDIQHALSAARRLFKFLRDKDGRVLNVAGNGIYTLAKAGLTQTQVDLFITSVIAKVHAHHALTKVISGGQTGVDLSGAVAGLVIGVQTQVLLPRGFIQRGEDKVDRPHSADEIRAQIVEGAAAVKDRLLC
jgi:hypothetical protein